MLKGSDVRVVTQLGIICHCIEKLFGPFGYGALPAGSRFSATFGHDDAFGNILRSEFLVQARRSVALGLWRFGFRVLI